MTIHIHVERLVLDGLALEPHGAEMLRTAVGAELVALFEEPGAAASMRGGAVPFLRTSPVQFEPQASPARMGSQIARAVHGSVGR